MSEESLVKVHIDLPNHWATGGESIWAEDLGNNHYRLRNVPFHAYGVNFEDVVIAKPLSEDQIPEVSEVVERSGNETLRLYFEESISREAQVIMLDDICKIGASYERADDIYVAIDIDKPEKYNEIRAQLQRLEDGGKLSFETCEMRIQGSFDDIPNED